jgi:hypothetical protein
MVYVHDEHPHVPLSDWRAFVKDCSPNVIDQVIERHECCLPEWFVPLARGGAIAGDALLRKVGNPQGIYRWQPGNRVPLEPTAVPNRPGIHDGTEQWGIESDVFECWLHKQEYECLVVRLCNNGLWTIESWNARGPLTDADQVLVHQFGSTPIFARTLPEAKDLAIHCFVHRRRPGSNRLNMPAGLRWVCACPKDYQVAVEMARLRAADEALCVTDSLTHSSDTKVHRRPRPTVRPAPTVTRLYDDQNLDARIADLIESANFCRPKPQS